MNCGKPGHLTTSGLEKGKKTGEREREATRAKDLEVPKVHLGLRTLSSVDMWKNLVTMHEVTEEFQSL